MVSIVKNKTIIKQLQMTLNAQTKVGLTFGQIFAIIAVVASFIMGYANLQIRMSSYEQKQIELQARMTNNETQTELVRKENREEHRTMIDKIDKVLENQAKR